MLLPVPPLAPVMTIRFMSGVSSPSAMSAWSQRAMLVEKTETSRIVYYKCRFINNLYCRRNAAS